MLTSIGSRSSRLTRKSRDALIGPCSQAGATAPPPGARGPVPLPCGGVTPERGRELVFPTGSPGARPPRPIRSRAATSTTTGGRGSTTPARAASSPSGDACDSFHRWREDVAPGGRPGPRRLPVLARVEPDRAGGGRVLAGRPRPLPADVRRLPRARASRPVVTFHHFTTPRWLAERGGWEAPDAADRFARFCERAAAHLGDLIGWACTINEPNVVAVMGYFQGQFPPGSRRTSPGTARSTRPWSRAHRMAVDALRSGPGRLPGRASRCRWPRSRRTPGGEALRDADPRRCSRTSSCEATDGRRLRRGAVLHPDARRPRGPGRRTTRASRSPRWATSAGPRRVEHTVRRAAAVSGRPGRRHRERHRHRRRHRAHRVRDRGPRRASTAASTTASTCAATSYWSLLDNFEWDLGLRAQVRAGGGGPGHLRATAQAERPLVRRGGAGQPGFHSRRVAAARVGIGRRGKVAACRSASGIDRRPHALRRDQTRDTRR